MKKAFAISLVLGLAGLVACGGSASTKSQLKGDVEDYQSEGWLNDETFQVRALGAPNPDAKGFVRRRTQAERAALLNAQARVIELLVGAKVEGAEGMDSGESTGFAMTKEFEAVLKGGQIIKKSYDADDNCEIVYRIHGKDLKKRAESEAAKEDFRQ